VGETASLSYLQFLRHIVDRVIGGCRFTEGDFSAFMLESNRFRQGDSEPPRLDINEKTVLVQCFLDAVRITINPILFGTNQIYKTSGILDFGNKQEIVDSGSGATDNGVVIDEASLDLILAIGAQCRGNAPIDSQYSQAYFAKGSREAFEGMLCDPSLEMVRNFVLLAYFM
jgi:hypothetical protein